MSVCVYVNKKCVCREGMKKVPLLAEVTNSGLGMDYVKRLSEKDRICGRRGCASVIMVSANCGAADMQEMPLEFLFKLFSKK